MNEVELKRLMAQMKNTGYLRDVDLTPLTPQSINALYLWLRQIREDLENARNKSKRGMMV